MDSDQCSSGDDLASFEAATQHSDPDDPDFLNHEVKTFSLTNLG
jgi:hypothetical protein